MSNILIDAQNMAFRAYFSSKSEANDFNMEYRMLQMLMKLQRNHPEATIRIVWDSWCKWRRDIYPDYKGHKSRLEMNPIKTHIVNRITSFKTVLSWILPQYSSEGCEADDVIAGLTLMLLPDHIYIVSTDRDMLQLVNQNVTVLRPSKRGEVKYDIDEVKKEWGVSHPRDLRWFKAYIKDTSDNLPGSGVPKKLIAKCVSGVWVQEADLASKTYAEHEWITQNARALLSKGWLKRFLDFEERSLINLSLMDLLPPKLGPFIRCEYDPNFHRFSTYCTKIGASGLLSHLINVFGDCPARDHPSFISNPWKPWPMGESQ